MPPRLRLKPVRPSQSSQPFKHDSLYSSNCRYATAAAAITTTPAPSISHMTSSIPVARRNPVQPPSHRPPEHRRSQLLRSYVSLIQSTPLILLFQHNNVKATEWTAIRRELAAAMKMLDQSLTTTSTSTSTSMSTNVKLQIIQTNIFEPALRVAEFYKPPPPPPRPNTIPTSLASKHDPTLTHALSEAAYHAALKKKGRHPLTPLLTGSLALLTLSTVSPLHLKAALQILAPERPGFPAPTRRASPSYWDPAVQNGLKKLILLGARVDGRIFDTGGARWVGGLDGMDALRAKLAYMLEGVGAGITGALEGTSRSLYFTMESRRQMLEGEARPKDGAADAA